MSKLFVLLVSVMFLVSCNSGNNNPEKANLTAGNKSSRSISGNFSISGAYALYPLVKKWSDDFMKINPDVKITLVNGGTGLGIDDLQAKKVQLAMISRPLTDEELADSIWVIPVAKAGVAPIVNQNNPFIKSILKHGINPQMLIRLFTGDKPMTWGELLDTTSKDKVIVYTRADQSGAAVIWANFLWKESSDLKGIKITGDDEMIRNVQDNKLALGYCNFSYAFEASTGNRIKDIQVMPIDLDFDRTIDKKEIPFSNVNKAHRGLWLGYYPKNLTRELTFGSIGKPSDPVIREFIKYALTKGQTDVGASGFCELNDIYLKDALSKLQ